jgi:hypothetical protein
MRRGLEAARCSGLNSQAVHKAVRVAELSQITIVARMASSLPGPAQAGRP